MPMPQDPDWAGGTIYEDIQEVSTTTAKSRGPICHGLRHRRETWLVRRQCVVDDSRFARQGHRRCRYASRSTAPRRATSRRRARLLPGRAYEPPTLLATSGRDEGPRRRMARMAHHHRRQRHHTVASTRSIPPSRSRRTRLLVDPFTHPQNHLKQLAERLTRSAETGHLRFPGHTDNYRSRGEAVENTNPEPSQTEPARRMLTSCVVHRDRAAVERHFTPSTSDLSQRCPRHRQLRRSCEPLRLNISYMVAGFMALSAFFHFFVSSPGIFPRYTDGLGRHINTYR